MEKSNRIVNISIGGKRKPEYEDIPYYQKINVALTENIILMKEIEEVENE